MIKIVYSRTDFFTEDLNTTLKQRPPIDHVWIEGPTNKEMTVAVGPSYADHPLLTGPRYRVEDVRLLLANALHYDMSGLLVVGIGRGTKIAHKIREAKHTKFYRVKGILGQATDNFFTNGRVVEKSNFHHVHRHHIDMICASMQSSHQKEMFKYVFNIYVFGILGLVPVNSSLKGSDS